MGRTWAWADQPGRFYVVNIIERPAAGRCYFHNWRDSEWWRVLDQRDGFEVAFFPCESSTVRSHASPAAASVPGQISSAS